MAKTLSLEEQEVTISFSRIEDYATVYSSDSTFITLMDKRVKTNPEEFSVEFETPYGKSYKFPKKYISIRCKTREISDEQREAAKVRFQNYHKSKKSKTE